MHTRLRVTTFGWQTLFVFHCPLKVKVYLVNDYCQQSSAKCLRQAIGFKSRNATNHRLSVHRPNPVKWNSVSQTGSYDCDLNPRGAMKWCADGWVVSLRSPLCERPQTACRLFRPGIGNPEVFISVFAEALSYSDSWGTCKTVDVFVKIFRYIHCYYWLFRLVQTCFTVRFPKFLLLECNYREKAKCCLNKCFFS